MLSILSIWTTTMHWQRAQDTEIGAILSSVQVTNYYLHAWFKFRFINRHSSFFIFWTLKSSSCRPPFLRSFCQGNLKHCYQPTFFPVVRPHTLGMPCYWSSCNLSTTWPLIWLATTPPYRPEAPHVQAVSQYLSSWARRRGEREGLVLSVCYSVVSSCQVSKAGHTKETKLKWIRNKNCNKT